MGTTPRYNVIIDNRPFIVFSWFACVPQLLICAKIQQHSLFEFYYVISSVMFSLTWQRMNICNLKVYFFLIHNLTLSRVHKQWELSVFYFLQKYNKSKQCHHFYHIYDWGLYVYHHTTQKCNNWVIMWTSILF